MTIKNSSVSSSSFYLSFEMQDTVSCLGLAFDVTCLRYIGANVLLEYSPTLICSFSLDLVEILMTCVKFFVFVMK